MVCVKLWESLEISAVAVEKICNACGVLCAEEVAYAHSPTYATVKPSKLDLAIYGVCEH